MKTAVLQETKLGRVTCQTSKAAPKIAGYITGQEKLEGTLLPSLNTTKNRKPENRMMVTSSKRAIKFLEGQKHSSLLLKGANRSGTATLSCQVMG